MKKTKYLLGNKKKSIIVIDKYLSNIKVKKENIYMVKYILLK